MNPLISVIIPVYNHAHTLKRTIDSILKQSYRPLEVIVVNDGSTDNFTEVAKSVIPMPAVILNEMKDLSLSVKIINQSNQGAPTARNHGFAVSKGEYVIFWDADTLANPQMLEKMFIFLQKHPEASYAYSQFKFGWKKIKSQNFDSDKLKKINYIDVTSLIRRSAILDSPLGRGRGGLDVGPFDTSLKRFQDWDLWLTLLERNKTGVFIPEVLYEKVVGTREGISTWLPCFMYLLPWKSREVKKYEFARQIIAKKHHLS